VTLRRGLQRLDGVANAKLILKPPHMQVRMKPGYWPDIPRMQSTIKEAGYTPIPEGVDLVVTGKVVQGPNGRVLELDRMRSPLTIQIVASKENAETAAHLERHVGDTVELEGRWQPPPLPGQAAGHPPQASGGALAVTMIIGAEDARPRRAVP
jgi:hypothetical protein